MSTAYVYVASEGLDIARYGHPGNAINMKAI